MSARVVTPRSLSAASIRGPTPGNSLTGLARSSLIGVRAGSPFSVYSLEVGHAIGSQAHVRPYDAPDLRDRFGLDPEPLGQLLERIRRADVPEVERTSGLRGGRGLLDDGIHLALAPAGALVRDDLAVYQLEHGPDVECRADEALGAADPAALRQVLERPDRE